MVICIASSILLIIYGNTVVRALMILYVIFAFFSKQPTYGRYDVVSKFLPRVREALRGLPIWDPIAKSFPMTMVTTTDIGEGPHVISSHPHGVICVGVVFALYYNNVAQWHKQFPKARVTGHILNMIMCIPFLREYLMLMETGTADKKSIEHTIKNGGSALIFPGGAQEALLIPCNNEVPIVLKTRKGFVRIAMQHKVPLIPSYTFGEHDLYKIVQTSGILKTLQEKFKAIAGFSIPLFFGAPFTLLPRRTPVKVVLGAPLRTDDYEGELTEELVAKKHEEYKEALKELFEKHRGDFYPPEYKLTYV